MFARTSLCVLLKLFVAAKLPSATWSEYQSPIEYNQLAKQAPRLKLIESSDVPRSPTKYSFHEIVVTSHCVYSRISIVSTCRLGYVKGVLVHLITR